MGYLNTNQHYNPYQPVSNPVQAFIPVVAKNQGFVYGYYPKHQGDVFCLTKSANNQGMSPDSIANQYTFNNYTQQYAYYNTPHANTKLNSGVTAAKSDLCPWVKDPEIKMALNLLGEIEFPQEKLEMVKEILGIKELPFKNGKEALEIIKNNNIKVDFIDMGDSVAHAFYENNSNTIGINKNYQGKMTFQMALGISLALLHEAGHAKDKDGKSSIQEELECLALNSLGYDYFNRKYPDILKQMSESRLISDGVALYHKLFFDQDPNRLALRKRVNEKYGSLPLVSPHHDRMSSDLFFASNIKSDYLMHPQATMRVT